MRRIASWWPIRQSDGFQYNRLIGGTKGRGAVLGVVSCYWPPTSQAWDRIMREMEGIEETARSRGYTILPSLCHDEESV